MEGLLLCKAPPRPAFTGFGATDFATNQPPLHRMDLSGEPKDLRRRIREKCPCDPGVYGMVDRYGHLIYVGMSAQLRDRLLTYFTKGPPHAKEQRVAERAHRLVWEVGGHEFTVRLRELELIRRWRPRFNARGRPERSKVGYVYVTTGEAPRFRAGRLPPKSSRWVWGPVRLSRRLRVAVDRLNYVFKLRDCPQDTPIRYAEQQTLFHENREAGCMRGPLATCLAPCAGGCTRHEYAQQIEAARSLLDGSDTSVLESLENAMQDTASRRDFEQAATLRDAWTDLTFLHEHLKLIHDVRRDYWFVYPVPCHTGVTLWMLVAGGSIAKVVRQPDSEEAAYQCLQSLEATFDGEERKSWAGDFDQTQLVASWFRQYPEELKGVLQPEQATEYCRRASDTDCSVAMASEHR